MSVLLIPCYEPDERLLDLVAAVRARRPHQRIVLVDDGSGPRFSAIFDAAGRAGTNVVRLDGNRGKGHALKEGLGQIARWWPGEDVVCADCDGQHTPVDIERVAAVLQRRGTAIVLGSRRFVGDVPARSRFGNTMTRAVFGRMTGRHLHDTQTGLRGYRAELIPWLLAVRGERFEYELDVLLAARRDGIAITEVDIATVYHDGNRSSHFRPVADSARVYVPLLKFSCSSLAAFVLDAALLLLCFRLTGNLLVAVVTSRVASASANFAINGRLVFDRYDHRRPGAAYRYAALVIVLLGANYLLLLTLTSLGVPLLAAKVLTELTLFLASYDVQRRFVFGTGPASAAPDAAAPAPPTAPPVAVGVAVDR